MEVTPMANWASHSSYLPQYLGPSRCWPTLWRARRPISIASVGPASRGRREGKSGNTRAGLMLAPPHMEKQGGPWRNTRFALLTAVSTRTTGATCDI